MLTPLHADQANRLRDYLAGVNYTTHQLRDQMGLTALPSRQLRTLPRMLDCTREPIPLHTLVRWFFIGVPVDAAQAREALPGWLLTTFLESGLLSTQGGALLPAVRITPIEKLLIVSDSALDFECSKPSDLVLWPNPTTRLLSWFTIRRPSRRTLDFGAGCGLQAMEAAVHSQTVVATDINPKATEFALFNARLNGLDNIEFLTGDAFAPIQGRRFDLIVANPPFFITPSKHYIFCDNNLDLDQFCRRLCKEAPDYLDEDGYFQMLCEWAQIEGEPWQDRLTEWLRGTGCDAWVLKATTSEPSTYAQNRFRESTPYREHEDDALFGSWMDYYRQRKVEAVHGGMIAMRRRSGANWIRIEDLPGSAAKPFGESILRMFTNRDFLDAHSSDEQMLAAKLKLSPDAQLDQQFKPADSKWQRTSLVLRLTGGFPASLNMQPLVAEFISNCDGARTLGELTGDLAGKVNAGVDQVRKECLTVVRQLIERGFLIG
jgi:hypothetical protein